MQLRKKQNRYVINLEFRNGITRFVTAKASSREIAEHRALKRNPEAVGVKRT